MTELSTRDKFAFGLTAFALLGTHFFYRDFVKIQIFHSLFILELVFGVWVLLVLSRFKNFASLFRSLWFILPFFLWGVFHFTLDAATFFKTIPRPVPVARFFQHGLLFVYPMIWTLVGTWMANANPKWTQKIFLILFFISVAPHLTAWKPIDIFGYPLFLWINISVGPVFTLLVGKELVHAICKRKPGHFWLSVLGLAILCLPFWILWHEKMQRTPLALLVFMMLTVPFVVSRKFVSSIIASIFMVGVLAGGMVLPSLVDHFFEGQSLSKVAQPEKFLGGIAIHQKKQTAIAKVKDDFFESMQHGDDGLDISRKGSFEARGRRFMWGFAIDDWKKRPMTGIGFIPEVPSWIWPTLKNSREAWLKKPKGPELPISGPHNSYLTILARTGVIGAIFFTLILFYIGKKIIKIVKARKNSLYDLCLIYFPINALLYAAVNVGFESPHNSLVLWVTCGVLFGLETKRVSA